MIHSNACSLSIDLSRRNNGAPMYMVVETTLNRDFVSTLLVTTTINKTFARQRGMPAPTSW